MPGFDTCSADIIDHTLICVPDFKTFSSLIKAAKIFYTTFQARPHSIIRAVAYNEVGDSLPQALRLVRCEAGRFHDADVNELPEENNVMNTPIQPEEARMLTKNVKVIYTLEDLFSWRCKDRTSQASRLTRPESYKFRRALYRFWLYSAIYGFQVFDENSDDSDPEPDEDEMDSQDVLLKRQDFLASFAGLELDEIERISWFLKDTAAWVIRAEWRKVSSIEPLSDLALCCGPRILLQCYEDVSIIPLEVHWVSNYPDAAFLSGPLDLIRKDRGQGSHKSISDGKVILSEVFGEDDICQHCGERKGLELWNETNWNYLTGILNSVIHERLPGKLPGNFSETIQLRDTLKEMQYSVFMKDLFSQKMAPYDQLSEQDLLCIDCLSKFLQHHLVQWWLNHKREVLGVGIPQNCWYGWNCRTMLHKTSHAMKLNHLCMPTRGSL